MKIEIDVDIPDSCADCRFCVPTSTFMGTEEPSCVLEKSFILCDIMNSRPDWCPIKEEK